jgi:MYXO-CTERM domain-containing protein
MQASFGVLGGQHGIWMRSPGPVRAFRAIGLLCAAALTATSPCIAATRYVFSTFKGDSAANEKLSIYTSSDGLNFTLLSNTGYSGPTGVLRDPSLMKHSDGQYYVAYTLQSWDTSSTSFGIAKSTDLTHWAFLVEVPAQVNGAKHTWAPEWFKDIDGSIHLIVSVDSPEWDFKPYLYTASNDTLTQWTAPKALGFGPNYIDTFIVTVGSKYHAFCKNETTKYIEHATATSLLGPWTFVGTNDWAGWGSGKEGIALFPLDNGDWRMFLDCYGGCGYLYATSSDLTKWSSTATVPGGLSGTVRHGTVLREEIGSGGSTSTGGSSNTSGSSTAANGGRSNLGSASALGGTASQGGVTAAGGKNTGGLNTSDSGGSKAAGGTKAVGGTKGTVTGGASGSGGSTSSTATAIGGYTSTATKTAGGTLAAGGMTSNDNAGTNGGGTRNSAGNPALGGTQSTGGIGATGGVSSNGSTQTNAGASNHAGGGTTGDVSGSNATDTGSQSGCSCSLPGRPAHATWIFAALAALGLTRRRRHVPSR